MRRLTRRTFLGSAAATALAATARPAAANKLRWPWNPANGDYLDTRTRARVRVLTTGASKDRVVDHTHPMWAQNMNYLIFESDRTGGETIPHARQMGTGFIRPLATKKIDAFALTPKSGWLYMMNGRAVTHQSVTSAFQKLRTAREIAQLPSIVAGITGGLSVDANEEVVYFGVVYQSETTWGVEALDPRRNRWVTMGQVRFPVGRVQAHPTINGLVMFSDKTGGDVAQRTWLCRADAPAARPFYRETFEEFVNDETWWGSDRALFTLWPYDDEHLKEAHGIVSVDVNGRDLRVHARYPMRHTHGSADGRWILGGDLDCNIWLIDVAAGERRLLIQGRNGAGIETRLQASFTPDSQGIVFQSNRSGTSGMLLVEIPKWESLPPLDPL